MEKLFKDYWFLGLVIIGLMVGAVYAFFPNQTQTNSNAVVQTNSGISFGTTPPQVAPTETLKSEPNQVMPLNTMIKTEIPNGAPGGKLNCNYLTPVGPGSAGTANISARWSNFVTGKNGTAKAEVCLLVNGAQNLMSVDNSTNGTRDNSAPWLAPNVSYTFYLFDEHGGDLAQCGGTVISQCSINTTLPVTATPAPGRVR